MAKPIITAASDVTLARMRKNAVGRWLLRGGVPAVDVDFAELRRQGGSFHEVGGIGYLCLPVVFTNTLADSPRCKKQKKTGRRRGGTP